MKLLQSYLKNKPSSQSPKGIVNHELFLKKNRAQATSNRRAGGTQKVQAPGVGGPIVHKQLIHRLSTEKIFSSLLMGFSMKKWEHEKSKNYCSCEPTHDQVQPETRRGVSGSNSEAQRQNLLRSRSALLRLFKNCLSTTQTSKLWGCVLGGDRGERDSLRLDRGSPGQAKASLHQIKAQDGSPTWVQNLGRLGNIRASQERRRKVRWRAKSRHRSRESQKPRRVETERRNSISRRPRKLGRLNSIASGKSGAFFQVRPDLGIPPNLKTHKLQALKHQA